MVLLIAELAFPHMYMLIHVPQLTVTSPGGSRPLYSGDLAGLCRSFNTPVVHLTPISAELSAGTLVADTAVNEKTVPWIPSCHVKSEKILFVQQAIATITTPDGSQKSDNTEANKRSFCKLSATYFPCLAEALDDRQKVTPATVLRIALR